MVFLDTALKNVLNIDPRKQSFTIKITGGPDGDVSNKSIQIISSNKTISQKLCVVVGCWQLVEDSF